MQDRLRPIDWELTSVDFHQRMAEIADVVQLAA